MNLIRVIAWLIMGVLSTQAQLSITISPPIVVGQKAVVKLVMKNNLTEKVDSARAVCFLLDDQGKMVGQATKWVIGQNKVGLLTKDETTFNFVITSPQSFVTTNLTAKVSFTRVVVANNQIADVTKVVEVLTSKK